MSMLQLHLGASLVALASIAAALAASKGEAIHRIAGRVAALALVVSALASFGLPEFGRLGPIHILSVVVLVNVPVAVLHARAGRIRAHRRAMLSSAGGLIIAGLFAVFAPGRYLHGVFFG